MIVGAVTGSLRAPEVLVVGRYRGTVLEVVGRTVKLQDDQAAEIGKLLKPAGLRHPWPDEISTHWGRGSKTPLIKRSATLNLRDRCPRGAPGGP
ncbi:hypothetical protein EV642_121108 [Kribbella sp. VKM Ac-2500]|nr:hypothetical protein EV642_121108 [Kribbella sp. VKM Ac-2500]